MIVLQLYDRIPKTKVRFSRHNIYMRDGNTCQYCGRSCRAPISTSTTSCRARRAAAPPGKTSSAAASTATCQRARARPNRPGMKLLKAPVRPRWTPTFRAAGGSIRYREWLPFLGLPDACYWNVELED